MDKKLYKLYTDGEWIQPQSYDGSLKGNAETYLDGSKPNIEQADIKTNILIVDDAFTVSSSIYLKSNTTITFTKNGSLDFENGGSIDCATPIEINAGPYQIFENASNDSIKCLFKNEEVYPEWFGAKGDGKTDDSDAINQCIRNAHRNTVVLGASFYKVNKPIVIKYNLGDVTAYDLMNLYTTTFGVDAEIKRHHRKIVINGSIIGDPSIKGPVIYVFGFGNSTLEINGAIYVRDNSPHCCGILFSGLIERSDIFINNIVREEKFKLNNVLTDSNDCGYGIVFAQGFKNCNVKINSIFGFNKGFVIVDRRMLETMIDRTGTFFENNSGVSFEPDPSSPWTDAHYQDIERAIDSNTATTSTNPWYSLYASMQSNRISLGFINNTTYPIWMYFKQISSFFNNNVIVAKMLYGRYAKYDEMDDSELFTNEHQGTAITVNHLCWKKKYEKFAQNDWTLDQIDFKGKCLIDFNYVRGGHLNIHSSVQDIGFRWLKISNSKLQLRCTDCLQDAYNSNTPRCKAIKFNNVFALKVHCNDKMFGEIVEFNNCNNITIDNVYFIETLAQDYALRTDPEVWYAITTTDKPIFEANLSVLEDDQITYSGISGTTTPALILIPKPRYVGNVHYVQSLPTALGTTNHLFYALTSQEFGTNIKLYKLYDSLGRQVGYVYKN